jgi:hypothetical protein
MLLCHAIMVVAEGNLRSCNEINYFIDGLVPVGRWRGAC